MWASQLGLLSICLLAPPTPESSSRATAPDIKIRHAYFPLGMTGKGVFLQKEASNHLPVAIQPPWPQTPSQWSVIPFHPLVFITFYLVFWPSWCWAKPGPFFFPICSLMWSEEKTRLYFGYCNVLTWIIWWCVHTFKPFHTSTHTHTHRYKWHYWLNGHEFEQTQGDSEGHGSLACRSSWVHRVRHDLGTEQQQNLFQRQLLKSKSMFKEAARTMLGFPYDSAVKNPPAVQET